MPLTRSQGLQGGSVIFLHPLVSIIQQQAYRCRCSIKLINFQPLYHFPVTTCKITKRFFICLALTYHHKCSAGRLRAKAKAVTAVTTEQNQWQLLFFPHSGCTDVPECHRHAFQRNGAYLPLSPQVTPDGFLNLLCHTPTSSQTLAHHFLTWVRVHWSAFKQDRGASIAEWSIHNIAMSCDPANIGHTAKNITFLVVKYTLQR